jgi:hypothetical protein
MTQAMPVNQTDPKLDDGDEGSMNPTETDADETAEKSEADDPA